MSEEVPRVTGLAPLDRVLHAWETTPPESKSRRLLYAFLLGVGLTMTTMGSMLVQAMGPIPLRFIPDLRIFAPLVLGISLGLGAGFGGVSRRRPALWTAVVFTLLFHLEEATVSWIGLPPGSITGTRVGFVGTAGSLLSLLSVLLMHVETESVRLRRDLEARGADPVNAEHARASLARMGARRLVGIAAGIGALALTVRAAEVIVGNTGPGGAWVLILGALLLFGLASFLLRLVKAPAPAEQPGSP